MGIVVLMLVLTSCAGYAGHAPLRDRIAQRPGARNGQLQVRGSQPERRLRPFSVCGGSLSGQDSGVARSGIPCTPVLPVTATARPSGSHRPPVVYSRKPCWCGKG
jgi:hypothetical protein